MNGTHKPTEGYECANLLLVYAFTDVEYSAVFSLMV